MEIKHNMTIELRSEKGTKLTSWAIECTTSQWLKLEHKISELLNDEGV